MGKRKHFGLLINGAILMKPGRFKIFIFFINFQVFAAVYRNYFQDVFLSKLVIENDVSVSAFGVAIAMNPKTTMKSVMNFQMIKWTKTTKTSRKCRILIVSREQLAVPMFFL